jgi:hypothetical protein
MDHQDQVEVQDQAIIRINTGANGSLDQVEVQDQVDHQINRCEWII